MHDSKYMCIFWLNILTKYLSRHLILSSINYHSEKVYIIKLAKELFIFSLGKEASVFYQDI